MLIFLDFDDVLFNTKKFKDDYFDLFKKRGVTRDIFEKFYYDPLDKRVTKSYSPVTHIERVCKQLPLDYAGFEELIVQFIGDTRRYVFKDVVKFLKNFPKKELYLISFSKTNFQKLKIFNSGIAEYFSQVKIVDELKGNAIRKIIKNRDADEKIYFIDDRVEHLTDAKIKNPNIITIFLLRKEGRHRDKENKYCDFAVKNIGEIFKIINSR